MACAQAESVMAPENVVQLNAEGNVMVAQDILQISLTTNRQGPQAAAVQAQLKSALDEALKQIKPLAVKEGMEVRTGTFSLYPRYDKDGRIGNWQGSVEVVLEGRDFERITQTAGGLQTLTVGNVAFGLSRERKAAVEKEAQAKAIADFRNKASELVREFGFKGYALREVSVNASDNGPLPQRRAMAMVAKSMDSSNAPIPVEPGQSRVTVTVSGSIQMR